MNSELVAEVCCNRGGSQGQVRCGSFREEPWFRPPVSFHFISFHPSIVAIPTFTAFSLCPAIENFVSPVKRTFRASPKVESPLFERDMIFPAFFQCLVSVLFRLVKLQLCFWSEGWGWGHSNGDVEGPHFAGFCVGCGLPYPFPLLNIVPLPLNLA